MAFLLTEGSFGEYGAENPPESYMASPDFIPLAENAADNWYGALQLVFCTTQTVR